jgi:uncharacterized protein (TIGR01319 family)
MEALALIDFGSTNTKVTAVDSSGEGILGAACAYTTVETDVGEGLRAALDDLERETGPLSIVKRFACSSAAGGLRMVTSGLVPALTAEAARLASLGAGAKVIRLFSYELTGEDIEEIIALKPDIFLLTGGVDGGNRDCPIHNAGMLARGVPSAAFPVIFAGNRTAAGECEKLLAGWEFIKCGNVMPVLGKLNIEPVQQEIRNLFLRRIIHAKGLSRESELVSGILMPTPQAVKKALELLAWGPGGTGELVAVDLGGATTDVYSAAKGRPQGDNVIIKGLIEPDSKRTVEGDIGMRYSAAGVAEAVGAETLASLAGTGTEEINAWVGKVAGKPDTLPETGTEDAMDFALAAAAVETAVTRHAGTIEEAYTPMGRVYVQTGKDLTTVPRLVLTGGALIHNSRIPEIARGAMYNPVKAGSLRPREPEVFVDKRYILAAMGLLGEIMPDRAITIMKKEIRRIQDGTGE